MIWAYGITTVLRRKNDLLPRTLQSLADGGFPSPRLFVDGATSGYEMFGLPITYRAPPVVNAFGNWILGMTELLIRNPTAHYYAMFQDDIVVCRNLRMYLEKQAYPPRGYWNLITFASNDRISPKQGGWFEAGVCSGNDPRKLQTGRGAVALVFNRETLLTLLRTPEVVNKPVEPGDKATKRIDGCVVNAMNNAGWREWVHTPSLVAHTGEVSTVGNKPHPHAGLSFPGETFDALALLKREDAK